MSISTTKNTWESICDLFSSIEIKESSIEIKESATYVDDSFSIHLETVVGAVHRSVNRLKNTNSDAESIDLSSTRSSLRVPQRERGRDAKKL